MQVITINSNTVLGIETVLDRALQFPGVHEHFDEHVRLMMIDGDWTVLY